MHSFFKTLILLSISIGLCMPVSAQESFKTLKGKTVKGVKQEIRDDGIFVFTENGGSHYPWQQIDADSLPGSLRERIRQRVLKLASHAQEAWENEEMARAKKIYKLLGGLDHFLHKKDYLRTEFQNIAFKKQGLIKYDGRWMSIEERQKSKGLVFFRGEWRKEEEVAGAMALQEKMLAIKAEINVKEEDLIALKQLIESNPNASNIKAAEELAEKLQIYFNDPDWYKQEDDPVKVALAEKKAELPDAEKYYRELNDIIIDFENPLFDRSDRFAEDEITETVASHKPRNRYRKGHWEQPIQYPYGHNLYIYQRYYRDHFHDHHDHHDHHRSYRRKRHRQHKPVFRKATPRRPGTSSNAPAVKR